MVPWQLLVFRVQRQLMQILIWMASKLAFLSTTGIADRASILRSVCSTHSRVSAASRYLQTCSTRHLLNVALTRLPLVAKISMTACKARFIQQHVAPAPASLHFQQICDWLFKFMRLYQQLIHNTVTCMHDTLQSPCSLLNQLCV